MFLLLLFSMNSSAQLITIKQAEAYGNELVRFGFMTAKGKKVLIEEINKGNIEVEHASTVKSVSYTSAELSKETVLQFCLAALITERTSRLSNKGIKIENKISPKEPLDDSSSRTFSLMDALGARENYKGCITRETSVFGSTRIKTLGSVMKSGLIDERIFNECRNALAAKQIQDEVDLLQYMLYRSTYYRFYDFNRREQESYIDELVKHGILTEEKKVILIQSYKEWELKTVPEILTHSSRYMLVDFQAYEPAPKQTYPVIFEAVKKLLPGFQYSDLDVQTVESTETDLIRQDLHISFTVNGFGYIHRFFHNYKKQNPDPQNPDPEPQRVDQDFHKGINKWLMDIESPYRLYTIMIPDDDENVYRIATVGLLLLKKGEDSLFSGNSYAISREIFDGRLSQQNLARLLTDLDRNSFFSHLTPSEIENAKKKIASSEINSIEDVLGLFPRTVVIFDWETGNLENPYEQLTNEFMYASRGAFKITDITDEFKKGWQRARRVKYGFTMNGKRYEKMLQFEDDWLDPGFLELLETALAEQKVDGSIYYCVDGGQVAGYIFLTATQYQFTKEAFPDLLKDE